VKAKDKATNKEQSIRIEASSGLSKEEIEKMQKDAEANAADDAKKKELVDARNHAEQLVYTAEKALKDAPTVAEDIKKGVTEKIEVVKSAIATGATAEVLKSATDALSTEMMKIGEAMSKQSAQPEGQPTQEPPKQEGGENPDIKDAETK
jgi:molecular chaperone DnaK